MTLTTIALMMGATIAVLFAASLTLPSSRTVSRSTVIDADVEDIYALIASSQGFQRFNPYHETDPDLSIQFFGPDSGVGAGFAFNGKEGKGTQTIIAAEQNRQIKMEINLGPMGKPIQTFDLTARREGTEVTWSTKSDFGYNPIGRVFGLFLEKMLGNKYELGLTKLAHQVVA